MLGASRGTMNERAVPIRKDHILIVDDDCDIRNLVAEYLERNDFNVSMASNGRELRRRITSHERFDLIVLDLMLPGEDGISLCRYLSESPVASVPVLMLTARSDDVDRIIGLEAGADDYLTKPFVPRELAARIRAILRRARSIPHNLRLTHVGRVLRFGEWRIDTVERCLIAADDSVSPLASAEYTLLSFFLEHPGRVITRDQLISHLMGSHNVGPFDRAIDLRVSRLRRRLEDDARNPGYIRTIRNEGYMFAKDVISE